MHTHTHTKSVANLRVACEKFCQSQPLHAMYTEVGTYTKKKKKQHYQFQRNKLKAQSPQLIAAHKHINYMEREMYS